MKLKLMKEAFEGQQMTTLKDEAGAIWFQAKDLAEPLGKTVHAIRLQTADLEPEDKAVYPVPTANLGERKATFVSESGALQIIVQSRKPAARRLRKWVCDVALRYSKGELHSTDPTLLQTLAAMQQTLVELTKAVVAMPAIIIEAIQSSQPRVRLMGARNTRDLPLWSIAEHKRQRQLGYITTAEVLAHKLGRQPTAQESSALTARTIAYCRSHDLKVNYFYQGGRARVYLPQVAAEAVHRTGWTVKTQIMAEAQESLFGAMKVA